MTLNITIIAQWGIWQCADHRLTNPSTGADEENDSAKQLSLITPDGGALLAYAGIGSVNNLYISDWIREILRGESRSLVATLNYLREQATLSLGPIVEGKFRHMFTIGGFVRKKPGLVQIMNFEHKVRGKFGPPLRQFRTVPMEIKNDPVVSVWGDAYNAISGSDLQELIKISTKRPNKLDDFHGLLAKFNRIAANHKTYGKSISPSCSTSFMPPEGEGVKTKLHGDDIENVQPVMTPTLFRGVDLTETMKVMSSETQRSRTGDHGKTSKQDFKKRLEEAVNRSVLPKDLIRRK